MSLVHMYLKRTLNTPSVAEFRVICGDIVPGEWHEVGNVVIDKLALSYDFFPCNSWLKEKVIPPKIFALSPDEIKQVCERDYVGYGWGAWSCRIHEWTTRLIAEKRYPEQAPLPR